MFRMPVVTGSGDGAEAGTRTPMALRPLAPEASASANSATSALQTFSSAGTSHCSPRYGLAKPNTTYDSRQSANRETRGFLGACWCRCSIVARANTPTVYGPVRGRSRPATARYRAKRLSGSSQPACYTFDCWKPVRRATRAESIREPFPFASSCACEPRASRSGGEFPLSGAHEGVQESVIVSTKLYVGNLPYEVTEDELQELFATAGTVESVNVMRDRMTGRARGFAFVEMATDDEAQAATSAPRATACACGSVPPTARRSGNRVRLPWDSPSTLCRTPFGFSPFFSASPR